MAVAEAVADVVRPFVPPAAAGTALPLRWGSLFVELDDTGDAVDDARRDYVTAIELIYEGYLFHYRQSRVAGAAPAAETALLAGDCLYARGLRLIAVRGDSDAGGLLARLMAACSYLRSAGAPFAADDALWAYTMGGLAALRRGVAAAATASLFEELDAALSDGLEVDVPALARDAARRLGLRRAAPLERALGGGR